MLTSLFKPKWQNKKPEVRITAIASLTSETEKDLLILQTLALRDPSVEVRKAALGKLDDYPTLLSALLDEDPQVASLSRAQVIQQLEQDNELPSVVEQWAKQDQAHMLALSQIDHALIYTIILQHCDEESLLADLVRSNATSSLRQQAAELITSLEIVEPLSREMRSKDKGCYRILKARLDTYREQEREANERTERIERLAESMQQMLNIEWHPQFEARFEMLFRSWSAFGDHPQQGQTLDVVEQLREKIRYHKAAEDARQQAEARADAQRTQANAILAELSGHLEQAAERQFPSAEQLEELQRGWLALESDYRSDLAAEFENKLQVALALPGMDKRLNNTRRSLDEISQLLKSEDSSVNLDRLRKAKQRINKASQQLNWPDSLGESPVKEKSRQLSTQIDQRIDQIASSQAEALESFIERLAQLEETVAQGQVKQAESLEHKVTSAFGMLATKPTNELQQRYKSAQADLAELKRWQTFAVIPKKEALCAKMEQLAESELDPEALAGQIKQLQEEWKLLAKTDTSASRSLWHRFRKAADIAYQPCDQHFQQQRTQREQNLAHRTEMCDQLEAYLGQVNWDTVNWSDVENLEQQARREWRNYAPVDRSPGKVVQQRFDKLLKQLQAPLRAAYDTNGEAKQALVNEIKGMLDEEITPELIARAKEAQQDWKQIGRTVRSLDHKLWNQFRGYCNQLFESYHEQSREHSEKKDRLVQQLRSITERLEAVESNPTSPRRLSNLVEEATAAYNALLEQAGDSRLPNHLVARYQSTVAELESELQSLKPYEGDDFIYFQRRVLLCQQLEDLMVDGAEAPDATLQTLDDAWAVKDECPKAYLKPLQERFDHAKSLLGSTAEVVESYLEQEHLHLRKLCIRLEIALGESSPEEDQAVRMEYQMERLQQALAQQHRNTSLVELRKLELEWQASPLSHRFDDLGNRFNNLLSVLD